MIPYDPFAPRAPLPSELIPPDQQSAHQQIEALVLGEISVRNYEYLTQRADLTQREKADYLYSYRFEPTPQTVDKTVEQIKAERCS